MSSLPPPLVALLERYKRLLEDRFGSRLQRLLVFGSYARGQAVLDSDLDVCVVIDDLTHDERGEAIDLAWAACAGDLEAPTLSPLVWTRAEYQDRLSRERRIARDIEREGLPV